MSRQNALLLRQLKDGLEQIILPEVSSGTARAFVDLAARILHNLVIEETTLPALAHELADAEGFVLDLASDRPSDRPATPVETVPATIFSPLEIAMSRVMAACGPDASAATREHGLRCFAMLVEAERRFRQQLDPEVALGRDSLFGGGRLKRDPAALDAVEAADDRQVTAERLQSYLRRRSSAWSNASVQQLSLLSGGFGKETILVTIARAGRVEDLVIRRDLPTSPNNTSVVDEFAPLSAAFAAGMRVPELLWLETDLSVFGTPFLLLRKVAGSSDISAWRDDPDRVDRCLRSWASQMALLHRIPVPRELSGDHGPLTTRDWISAQIDRFFALFEERRTAPVPLLAAGYGWLRANIPDSGSPPRLVHADLGFHNMLTADGEVTAILDWEYVHPGDPQEDLNYVRPFVESIGSWERFLAYYQAAGGPPYRPQDARFWEVWRGVWIGTGCVGSLHAFSSGNYANPDAAIKLAVAGLNFGPRHVLYGVERILDERGPGDR